MDDRHVKYVHKLQLMSQNMQNNRWSFKTHFPSESLVIFPEPSQKCHLALIRSEKPALLTPAQPCRDIDWCRTMSGSGVEAGGLGEPRRQMERRMVRDTGMAELLVVGLKLQCYWLTQEIEPSEDKDKRSLKLSPDGSGSQMEPLSLCDTCRLYLPPECL